MHEHPAYASSWQEEKVKEMLSRPEITTATCDQCLYSCVDEHENPFKKPTMFMSDSVESAKQQSSRCLGCGGDRSRPEGGRHGECRGKSARAAAVYHFKLCKAILVGLRNQLRRDGICQDGFVGVLGSSFEHEGKQLEYEMKHRGQVFNVQIAGERNWSTSRPNRCGR